MKIGICSPFMPHDLADLLDSPSREKLGWVRGVTATPVTPLAREWHRQGHSVVVFCLDPSVSRPIRLSGERLSIDVLPKRRFREVALDVYRAERGLIRGAIEAAKPDVIHANWSYEHALGALDSGVPTLVTCHDTPLRYAWISKTFFMAYHVFIAAAVFRRAEHLVAVSPYTADHIQRYFMPGCRVGVIPNGLSMEIFRLGERRFKSDRTASRPPVICSVGGWGEIKNMKSLLVAFGRIRRAIPGARLVLFGSGLGDGQQASSWAAPRGLEEGVEFRGPTPRKAILEFLSTEVDLMIHASLVECHPMVLIESIACGVPVIAGAESGGVAWTLGEGRHGKLCDVREPEEIASAAIETLRDLPAAGGAARRSWLEIREQFGIETVARKYLAILTSIQDQPSSQ